MKPFSLAGLLRLRQVQQDEAAGTLAVANRQVHSVQVRRRNAVDQLAATADSPISPEALTAIAAARSSYRSQMTEFDALMEDAHGQVTAAQLAFNQARSATVSLEKMQERHVSAETARELDVEQKALDEIAVNSYRRPLP